MKKVNKVRMAIFSVLLMVVTVGILSGCVEEEEPQRITRTGILVACTVYGEESTHIEFYGGLKLVFFGSHLIETERLVKVIYDDVSTSKIHEFVSVEYLDEG